MIYTITFVIPPKISFDMLRDVTIAYSPKRSNVLVGRIVPRAATVSIPIMKKLRDGSKLSSSSQIF